MYFPYYLLEESTFIAHEVSYETCGFRFGSAEVCNEAYMLIGSQVLPFLHRLNFGLHCSWICSADSK
jgi:hypothetical protein